MRLFTALSVTALASLASAHFQLQYPLPRGVFVEDDEPSFCDGYTNAVNNRTTFPLSNGVISLNSEHPTWTVGVLVSTSQNPSSFNDFNNAANQSQLALNFFKTSGEGLACFNIDLSRSGISGVTDGANVSIEVVFDGGDGMLYQCADLTLSSAATVPSNATSSCNNVTSSESASSSAAAGTSTSTAPASTPTGAAIGPATVLSNILILPSILGLVVAMLIF